MTFAQALARIESIIQDEHHPSNDELTELRDLIVGHVHSIVQLGKVAREMREDLGLGETTYKYDKLMNGEEIG